MVIAALVSYQYMRLMLSRQRLSHTLSSPITILPLVIPPFINILSYLIVTCRQFLYILCNSFCINAFSTLSTKHLLNVSVRLSRLPLEQGGFLRALVQVRQFKEVRLLKGVATWVHAQVFVVIGLHSLAKRMWKSVKDGWFVIRDWYPLYINLLTLMIPSDFLYVAPYFFLFLHFLMHILPAILLFQCILLYDSYFLLP